MNKLQEYLDRELNDLDEALNSFGSDNLVKYQGVSTPVDLRKRMYLCTGFLEARSHFKMEHTLADESSNKGGLLLLKLAETMEKLPSKSPKILPSRDEGEGPAIEEHELEITEKRDTLKKESEDESKMNEEEKKIHERTMKEELRAHESDLVGI